MTLSNEHQHHIIDVCALTELELLDGSLEKRIERLRKVSTVVDVSTIKPGTLCTPVSITVWEDAICILLFFSSVGMLLWAPSLILILMFSGYFKLLTVLVCSAVFASFMLPRRCSPPVRLPRRIRLLLCRYFSFQIIGYPFAPLEKNNGYVFAGAPHGVFPFGDMLSLITTPSVSEWFLTGLGASAVLNFPLLGNLLGMY
jgi:hypothetical protein